MRPKDLVLTCLALGLFIALGGNAKMFAAPASLEPAGYGQERWEMPPREFNEIQQRGFRDGVEGARRDFGNHRNPDVDNREEYRHPDLPLDAREVYREAFRRGYHEAAEHLWSAAPAAVPAGPPPGQDWDRWGMRGLENDAERRGYRDGVEEGREDVEHNRRLDPDDQPQFRNPPVPPPLADEYREGFMRGYEVSVSQLTGGRPWEDRGENFEQWAPPDRFTEWQRRGFHDGVEGARKDFGNHRRPSVFNREEYREAHVPDEFRHEYREGFRRGYEMAASRLWGGM